MSKNNKDLNGQWGTHVPLLARVLDLSDGPVLELGTGVWSTFLIHIMCKDNQRKAISYDNDPQWHESNLKWQSDFHEIKLLEDWDELYDDIDFLMVHWGVILVDHKPAKRRMVDLRRLANRANFIVIHDSEPESDKFFKYSWIYKHYKYRYDYTKCRPHTTVLSNFIDVSKLLS